jgi:homogentisate 1,2-dioxygenase
MAAEHTFLPPWFHRSVMNDCMGLIHRTYSAKQGGFEPGGLSVHGMMVTYYPDRIRRNPDRSEAFAPRKVDTLIAIMAETRQVLRATRHALSIPQPQPDYDSIWDGQGKTVTGGRQ